ncbi:MAG: hypothetical protein ACHQZQ_04050 [SAR324 cluster bacterium]
MKKWLVMDVFHQVHGPYSNAEVKALLRRGNKFFVATPGFDRWVPVDFIPEFTYIPASDDTDKTGQATGKLTDAQTLQGHLSELVGICKGVIADGVVAPEEAVFLRDWLAGHQALLDCWPADVISRRLEQVFADGKVDAQEQADLLVLLTKISSSQPPVNQAGAGAEPLPVSMPEPLVQIANKRFCLSGRFVYGPHSRCREAIRRRGGWIDPNPGPQTDYLVIGGLSLSDWRQSPDGRKVLRAQELQKEGHSVRIVSEENWCIALTAN